MFQAIGHKEEGYLTGQLLIAMPSMSDARFEHGVIFIIAHDDQGAMGLLLNKPIDGFTFHDLLLQIDLKPGKDTPTPPVYYGGPVEVGRGFVLHSPDFNSPTTIQINDEFSLSATLEVIEAIALKKGPKQAILTLGYAGWSPGQLDQEVKDNMWLSTPTNDAFVFKHDRMELWHGALESMGIDPDNLCEALGHA